MLGKDGAPGTVVSAGSAVPPREQGRVCCPWSSPLSLPAAGSALLSGRSGSAPSQVLETSQIVRSDR